MVISNRISFMLYPHIRSITTLSSPDIVIGMLHVIYLDIYVVLDMGSNLSFVTLLIIMNFRVSPESFSESLSVSTLIGVLVIARQVYRNFPITVLQSFTLVYVIELEMIDINVICGMGWLYSFYVSFDCHTQMVKF